MVLREEADEQADRRDEAHDGHDDPDPDIISIVIPTIPPGRLAEPRRVDALAVVFWTQHVALLAVAARALAARFIEPVFARAQHRGRSRFFMKPPSSAPGAHLRQAAGTQKSAPCACRAAAANRMSFTDIARETRALGHAARSA